MLGWCLYVGLTPLGFGLVYIVGGCDLMYCVVIAGRVGFAWVCRFAVLWVVCVLWLVIV